MTLPVHDVLPELKAALAASPLALLQAPPGAGKSTVVPLELLGEDWLAGKSVVVLQPRRVAARAVAARLAENLGQDVGETVGYRVRFESRVGPRTRVEVVTEGILTRRLQRDPELSGVGLVIFDEFHERSLDADLAFVLCREVQGALRDDLRLLVMSATLDPALPSRLDPDAPVVTAVGRQYPVDVRYADADFRGDPAGVVARAVTDALSRHEGDVLAFLPGTGEIRRTQTLLTERHPDVKILPLYGDLPAEEQRRAILPGAPGERRVVLATSIAETSLTLEGVRVVVDSGLSRTARFDSGTGLTTLVTTRVTRDAAEQRAGRAGRVAPGVAYRLWTVGTHALLTDARVPEIMEADLAPVLLELAQWGVPDPLALPWPDPPPARAVTAGAELLRELDAVDADGRLTARGSRMLDLPTHPRLAHLLIEGQDAGLGSLAADVAALVEERDPLPRDEGADLTDRVRALRSTRAGGRGPGDRGVLARVERLARQWRSLLRVPVENTPPEGTDVGALLAFAYPERVARRRGAGEPSQTGRYLLAGGRGARLPEGDALAGCEYLAVGHLDAAHADGRVFLAAPLDPATLEGRAVWEDVVRWDTRTGALVARREKRVGALVLDEAPLRDVPPERRARAAVDAVRRSGVGSLPWSDAARQWQARVLSLRTWRAGEAWPDVSDAALHGTLDDWLLPYVGEVRRQDDLDRLDLARLLAFLLPWPQTARLDELAPTHLDVPSGSRVRLEYRPDGAAPVLAVKLQELFGLGDTPAVNEGRTPVLLHLLSPARRPVQVTQDLRGFWNRTYPEVRKELAGRYPKHPWPTDPWNAPPTARAKPRGT